MKFVRFLSDQRDITNTRVDVWVNPNAVSAVRFLSRNLSSLRFVDGGKDIDIHCSQEQAVRRLEKETLL